MASPNSPINHVMLSIFIPAHNEEENMNLVETELIPELRKIERWEIIFVDDGSTDKTQEKMLALKKKYGETIQIIIHEKNKGLGVAVQNGIAAAKGDLFIPLDADMTFHPREIHALLEEFQKTNADMVIGSHFSKNGKIEYVPFYRVFLSKAVNVLYTILLPQKIDSISSIFRLYKTNDLKKLPLYASGFDINAEILFHYLQQKKKIVEVPVTLGNRRFGVSKLNVLRETQNHAKMLLKILQWRIHRFFH